MVRRDQSLDFFEVKKEGDTFRFDQSDVRDIMMGCPYSEKFFDLTCLIRRGAIDSKKTFYRMSRIMGKTIRYDFTRLNCDHISTWILRGNLAWTTAVLRINPLINIRIFPGEVDERVTREIDEQLQNF